MTTSAWASVVDHTSDAGFRAWGGGGTEVHGQLATVGLVQTADTGQINWTTVTRPASNTAGGYEIWRFADSTLFLKLEFGTGASATSPMMWITVGTGSNGSGTITGQTSTRATLCSGTAPISTATVYTSFMCHVADAFSFCFKELSNITGVMGFVVVGKTTDGSGVATTTGFVVLRSAVAAGNSGSSMQSVRIVATAVTFTDTEKCAFIPGVVTSSTSSGGNSQAYELWMNTPDVTPFIFANTILLTEAARDTTFVVAMAGTTTRTYRSLGQISAGLGLFGSQYAAGTYSHAVIYE